MRSITTDVVVVGGGPVGLFAASALRRRGREVLLVESDDVLGGSAAAGDGTVWLPAVPSDDEHRDTAGAAEEYLVSLGMTQAWAHAFCATSPAVVAELTAAGVATSVVAGEPDAHPEQPGGRRSGRVREPGVASSRVLGSREREVRFTEGGGTLAERRRMLVATRDPRGLADTLAVFGGRATARLAGRGPVVGGSALAVGLAAAAWAGGATIWRGCRALRLLPGDTPGVVVERDGDELAVRTNAGVLLASGGFSRSEHLRARYLPGAASLDWSLAAPGTDGSMLTAAEELGAATAGFGDAEWRTAVVRADGSITPIDRERCLPFSILVDSAGSRFCNEAGDPIEVGRAMLERTREVSAVPSFLIMDRRHRRRFPLGGWPPRMQPAAAIRDGDIAKADTLNDLAGELGIDKAGLIGTIAAFNRAAKKGTDDDFGRGASAADKAHGSPLRRPNPSLGAIEMPPYWGVRVYPAEVSTRGGLVTDPDARVLTEGGEPIPGLFAAGALAAVPWGSKEPGPGAATAVGLAAALRAVALLTS